MRQTEMHLTEEDRTALKSFRSKGLHLAREVNRAQVGERSDAPVGSNRLEAPSQSSPQARIEWKFTRQDADHKLSMHYVS